MTLGLGHSRGGSLNQPWAECRAAARFFAAAAIVTIASMLGSCTARPDTALFSSNVQQIDFTFEYPRVLRVTPVEEYPDLVTFTVIDLAQGSLYMQVSVWPGLGVGAEAYARRQVNDEVSFHQSQPTNERNFVLLRNDKVALDTVVGYRIEFTVDVLRMPNVDSFGSSPTSADPYIYDRTIRIAVPRNGSVYELTISVGRDEWSRREKDIQHILDTFKWK